MTAGRSVLFVCDFNAHGGTQTHLLQLFEGLDRARHRPLLAALSLCPDLRERLGRLDVEVIDLALNRAFSPATAKAGLGLAARARRERVSLLSGFLYQGNVLTALVSRASGVPYVTGVRNMDLWKSPFQRRVSGMAHRGARRVVFNSGRVRDYVVGAERIPRDRTAVIYNGIAPAPPPADRTGRRGQPATAVCVASLREKKGHRFLLQAFAAVREHLPDARLMLAGEGPLRAELERLAGALGVAGAVDWLGYTSDVQSALDAADVFVLASLEEGMPNALLEAMRAGLPAVVTDVGGNAEVVEEGRTGFVVPSSQPGPLADRMARLLSDPPSRDRMGRAGRERVETRFSLERMVAACQDLYDEVIR